MSADFSQVLQQTLKDIRIELSDVFDKNFEKKSFFAEAWRREQADPGLGSLMMRTGTLRRSIRSQINGNVIEFYSEHPGAALHNEGGAIIVTARMKRFFWAKYYEMAGRTSRSKANESKAKIAEYYKALALKKVGDKITLPKRQFLGYAPEVEVTVRKIIEENLHQYFNKIDFTKK